MSNTTIPNLPLATSLNGSEQVPAVQESTSVRLTTAQIAAYTATTYPAPGVTSVSAAAPLTTTGGVPITTTGTISLALQGINNQYLAPMASKTVKANVTGTTGQPTDATVSSILDTITPTVGSVLYRDSTGWIGLGIGSNGQMLTSNGTSPYWASVSGSTTGVTPGTYGSATSVGQFTVLASGQISAATNVAIAVPASQVTGLGTMATQNANNVAITGGVAAVSTFSATSATFASATVSGALTLTTALAETSGGTGYSSYTTGDILVANSSITLQRLNDVATGNVLLSGGVGVVPYYGKVSLATAVSGTLPVSNGGTGAASLSGYVFGNGTGAFTASATIPNAGLTNSSITIGSTSISLGATTATLADLSSITLTTDPTTALQVTTKQYVDTQVSTVSNQTYHTAVAAASTTSFTATYNNGTSGVGATLTNANTQVAFSVDGYTASLNDRILIKNQASGSQNGIYTVTTLGSGSTNWVLTRATDFNTVGTGPNFIETGASTFVSGGSVNGSTSWNMNTSGSITVGTTSLNWTQISSSASVTVTSPLQKTGSVISLNTVPVTFGGTGLTSYTQGDLLVASSTTTLVSLPDVATGNVLLSGGVGASPSYGKVALASAVSGTLLVANGGTGTATSFTSGSVIFAGASGVYSQNNAKHFWDNTNFRLGLNTASPDTTLTILSATQTTLPSGTLPAGTDLHIVGADAANTRITQDAFGTGAYSVYTGRSARGTAASPTATQSGDFLTQFTGRGYGATGFATASTGYFSVSAAENFTDTAQGTYASIFTTATGGNTAAEAFRFGPAGQLGIGGATYGTSGYSFVSGGSSAAPTWSQVSLTAGVTGTLPVGNGGSGATTFTAGYLKASGTSAFSTVTSIPSSDITGLGTMSTQNANSVAITGGSINGTTVGASTASTGAFTTLSATTSANFTTSGTVTINPTTASTMNNVAIGGTTRAAGAFTTVSANAATSPSNTIGAISYGTNNFSDTDILANFSSSTNSYNQVTVQNTSAGAAASAEFIAYNNTASASSGFAAFGINSTGYTGVGPINAPSNAFFLSGGNDLVIGTINANAIHFATNSSATDAMTISSAGIVSLGTALAVTSGGTGVTTSTGSGSNVLSNSPTLVTPILGTPTSVTLTNATGLPILTGVSGLGTGVAIALTTNIGSSGAFVVNNGALGTPSSGTLTNTTGLPISTGVSGLGTGVATALAAAVNATGGVITSAVTTLSNLVSIGTITTGVWNGTLIGSTYGGTGVNNGSSTLTMAGSVTHAGAFTRTFTATANTSVTLPTTGTLATLAGAETLTNKRVTPRAVSDTSNSATPTINTDTTDINVITGQSIAITSFTTNLSGTPTNGQKLWIAITGTTAIAITWGASFEASTTALPTTTVSTNRLDIGFVWDAATSKWRCVAVA